MQYLLMLQIRLREEEKNESRSHEGISHPACQPNQSLTNRYDLITAYSTELDLIKKEHNVHLSEKQRTCRDISVSFSLHHPAEPCRCGFAGWSCP